MTSPVPVLTRDEADRELARLDTECDGISAGLMELDDHPGRRLLDGAQLTGVTAERWERTSRVIARLWDQYGAYRLVVDKAHEVRGRRAKPGRAELEELSRLLFGPSVELSGQAVPLERRGLVDPVASARRLTLAQTVAAMGEAWSRATGVVVAADAVWGELLPGLDRVEVAAAECENAVLALGGPQALAVEAAEIGKVRDVLSEAKGLLASDPLHFIGPDVDLAAQLGAADPMAVEGVSQLVTGRIAKPAAAAVSAGTGLARLEGDLVGRLDSVREALRPLVLVRQRYDDRAARVRGKADDLRTREADAARLRAHTGSRIVGELPAVPLRSVELRERMRAVERLHDEGDWRALSRALSALETDTARAGAELDACTQALQGALARRGELRGRFQAYRAMAGSRGRGEDTALGELEEHVRRVLWRAPCDLAAAERAVGQYQAAVTGQVPGATHRPHEGTADLLRGEDLR